MTSTRDRPRPRRREERGRRSRRGERGRRPARRRREPPAEGTGPRVLTAIPAIVFAIVIIGAGGPWFALGIFPLGVVALRELYQLMRRARPVDLAGYIALAGLLGAALYGGRDALPPALAASVPIVFLLALTRRRRIDVAWGVAATLFGILWIGLALSHAVLLRELPHGGALLTGVLIGTFAGDTAAYFGGRAWGRRPLAPLISPQKTLEGLLVGVVMGMLGFWAFMVGWHDFISGTDALLIGLCVAVAAPAGDLFESLIKRDLEAKDTGRFFGPHGGVLDRLDAVFFTVVVGYYASLAIL